MTDRAFKVVDLFCGCGGFSRGFEEAGFEILLGIDIWKDALVTYEKNHINTSVLEGDLSKMSPKDIFQQYNIKDVDVIIGGPPCQGFSVSGKRVLDDPRNRLYKAFVNFVKHAKPKVFIMENVPGLVKLFNGQAKEAIIEDFSEAGYNVTYKILSADSYGVPQSRKRVFFVGLNKDIFFENEEFIFPVETHGVEDKIPPVTCKEAIGDLPLLNENEKGEEIASYLCEPQNLYQRNMRKNSTYIYNHIATIHKEETRKIISLVPDGGNYKDLPKELQSTRKVNIAWTRMNSNKTCFTIDTGHNHHFHYLANRVPTVRESARIQSFPDDFIFYGTKTSQLKQVGNAVPPLLARTLALEVKKILGGK